MLARYRRFTARLIAACRRTPKPLRYAALSGRVLAEVEAGRLIRTGDLLDRLGADALLDGHRSWYGKHVAKAYRAANGTEPLRVWAQHRTTSKWVHVAVYSPTDGALYAGLATYARTRHLVAADFQRCA
jgi:hypothetical protein